MTKVLLRNDGVLFTQFIMSKLPLDDDEWYLAEIHVYLKAALDVALGEADTFGDADGLTDPFGEADALAEALALAEGDGSRLGSADGTIDAVTIGDGL